MLPEIKYFKSAASWGGGGVGGQRAEERTNSYFVPEMYSFECTVHCTSTTQMYSYRIYLFHSLWFVFFCLAYLTSIKSLLSVLSKSQILPDNKI
jgi:hypothetical protein